MKKSLVALAALAATTAFAQSSVTLYGNLDQSVFRSTNEGRFLVSTNSNGGSTSLWGIRGEEDLGGGTKVSFDLKSEINLATGQTGSSSTGLNTTSTTGVSVSATVTGAAANGTTSSLPAATSSNMFNRGAWIGLTNANLGDFKIGRQNDAWWETGTKFNNTGLNSFGWANATAMVSGTNSLKGLYGGNDLSAVRGAGTTSNNVGYMGTGTAFFGGVSYATPVFQGLQFKVARGVPKAGYTVDGNADQTSSWSLNYGNGPLTAAYAKNTRSDLNGDDALTQTLFGIKYVTGPYTLTYANNQTKVRNLARTVDGGHDAEVTALGVGYAVNAKWTVNAGWTQTKDKDTVSNKWTQTAVTGSYAFSKRTNWYVGYGRSANDGASQFGGVYAGNANSKPQGAGQSEGTIITGLRHQF